MTAEQIIAATAAQFGYTVEDLTGPDKSRAVSLARAVAMYAVRQITKLSYPAIGEVFNRDHSTIINGCRRVEKMLEGADEIREAIDTAVGKMHEAEPKKKLVRIHVNQHVIKANAKSEDKQPPITVKTYNDNRYANEVSILDDDGNVVATVVYRPDDPLSCGARVWIETRNEVKLDSVT